MHPNALGACQGASWRESEIERNHDRQPQREVARKVLCSVQTQWVEFQPETLEILLFHSAAAAAETFQQPQASWRRQQVQILTWHGHQKSSFFWKLWIPTRTRIFEVSSMCDSVDLLLFFLKHFRANTLIHTLHQSCQSHIGAWTEDLTLQGKVSSCLEEIFLEREPGSYSQIWYVDSGDLFSTINIFCLVKKVWTNTIQRGGQVIFFVLGVVFDML